MRSQTWSISSRVACGRIEIIMFEQPPRQKEKDPPGFEWAVDLESRSTDAHSTGTGRTGTGSETSWRKRTTCELSMYTGWAGERKPLAPVYRVTGHH
jgi:hypothetical protein